MSSKDILSQAYKAENDLNSYENRAGTGKGTASDESTGIDSTAPRKFPGADVKFGEDLVTNAGDNRRIPEEEGGDLDAKGRPTRGQHFEGEGGPEDKAYQQAVNAGGFNDQDLATNEAPDSRSQYFPKQGQDPNDVLAQGEDATRSNLASAGESGLGDADRRFKGEDYYAQEDVPDSIAAQGNIPPESVVQASRETEGYDNQ